MKVLFGFILLLIVLFASTFVLADTLGLLEEHIIVERLHELTAVAPMRWLTGSVLAILLTADLLLPVPSSIVMTLSGYALGFCFGTVVNFAGAMGSAVLGFWLCRRFGLRAFRTLVGERENRRVECLFERYGPWVILLSRPVPMLTEVVSCVSGLTGMSLLRFTLLSGAATLPLCGVYAWAGRTAETNPAAWWMLLAAVVLPAIGFAWLRLFSTRRAR